MEDVAYGLQDRVDRWRYRDTAPKTYWKTPAAPSASVAPATSDGAEPLPLPEPTFFPVPFDPPFPKVASGGDGIWVPVPDPQRPQAAVSMFKTIVHPDAGRTFAALAIVAIDVAQYELHLVAGTEEPKSHRVPRDDRPGVIPASHTGALVAAFNGGFKATHGHYGMMLGGVDFLAPRGYGCTLARYRAGGLRIGTWTTLQSERERMLYYRQTPPCLVEGGKIHSQLHYDEHAKGWGATVSGETVIRRSAIGLDRERKVLFYGIGDSMSAQAIARGMKAAGAHDVAELDVNHSYPRFLFYERPDAAAPPVATSCIIPTVEFRPDHYVGRPSSRDFFYLTRLDRS
jgi:hypothetical protein